MAMTKLGRSTTAGIIGIYPAGNYKWVSRITVGASNFTFVRGAVYGYSTHTTVKIRMVVYDATGAAGAPGNLVAQSNEVIGMRGYDWNTFTFPTSYTLTASTNYYIGIILDAQIYISGFGSSGTNYYNADTYSDGAAATWGTATTNTNEIAAYIAAPANEVWLAKSNGLAVLASPLDSISIAKGYGLAVLSQDPRIAVAKTYGLVVLDTNVTDTSRPTVMVCT